MNNPENELDRVSGHEEESPRLVPLGMDHLPRRAARQILYEAAHGDRLARVLCWRTPFSCTQSFWAWLDRKLKNHDPVAYESIEKVVWHRPAEEGVPVLSVVCVKVHVEAVLQALRELEPRWCCRLHKKWVEREHRRPVKERPALGTLRVASWNINSIVHKRRDVEDFIRAKGIKILALQETMWALHDWPIRLREFQVFACPRGGAGERGLALAVHESVAATEVHRSASALWIKVSRVLERPLFVGCVYRIRSNPSFYDEVGEYAAKQSAKGEVLLLGDWNKAMKGTCEELSRRGFAPHFVQFRGSPQTYHRKARAVSALDYMVASDARWMSHCVVDRRDGSDHWPIVASIRYEVQLEPPVIPKRKRVVLTADNQWKIPVSNIWEKLLMEEEGELPELWPEAIDQVLGEAGAWAEPKPRKNNGKKATYQSSKATRRLIKKRQEAYAALVRAQNREFAKRDEAEIKETLARYKGLKRQAAAAVRTEGRAGFARYLMGGARILAEQGAMRPFWSWVRALTQGRRVQAGVVVKDKNGDLAVEVEAALKVWTDYFADLVKDPTGLSQDFKRWEHLGPEEQEALDLDAPFDHVEMVEALKSLKLHKAPGSDSVPYEVLRLCMRSDESGEPTPMAKVLLRLLNAIYAADEFPEGDVWNVARVVPVPKKGDLTDCTNYRGIALLNTVVKLLCVLVVKRVSGALEKEGRLTRAQGGFRPKEEAISQVTTLYEICHRRKRAGKATYLLFVDFKKAYDMVPHGALLHKLRQIGVRGKALSFIQHIYAKAEMGVTLGGMTSDELFRVLTGVRQGDPASPTWFNVFINDIMDEIEGVQVPGVEALVPGLLFADDLVLVAESLEHLQRSLQSLQEWAETWGMSIGVGKCGVMAVGAPTKELEDTADRWRVDANPIPIVETYTYLGIEFNNRLDLQLIEDARTSVLLRRAAALRPFLRNRKVPISIRLHIVRSQLLPVALYGGELTGMNTSRCKKTQAVLDQILRVILGVPKNTCKYTLWQEAGMTPLWIMRAAQRARAYTKWGESRTYIADLIRARGGAAGWAATSRSWLTRQKINVQNTTGPKVFREVKRVLLQKMSKKTLAGGKYQREKLSKSSKYLRNGKATLKWPQHILRNVAKMRMGCFATGKRLVQFGHHKPKYMKQCFCCDRDGGPETLAHMLLECECWNKERREHLGPLLETKESLQLLDTPEGREELVFQLVGSQRSAARPPGAKKGRTQKAAQVLGWLDPVGYFVRAIWSNRIGLHRVASAEPKPNHRAG